MSWIVIIIAVVAVVALGAVAVGVGLLVFLLSRGKSERTTKREE